MFAISATVFAAEEPEAAAAKAAPQDPYVVELKAKSEEAPAPIPVDAAVVDRLSAVIAEVEARRAASSPSSGVAEDAESARQRRREIAEELVRRRDTRRDVVQPTMAEIQARRERIVEELRKRRAERDRTGAPGDGATVIEKRLADGSTEVISREPSDTTGRKNGLDPMVRATLADMPVGKVAPFLRQITGKEVFVSEEVAELPVQARIHDAKTVQAVAQLYAAFRAAGVVADESQPGRILLLKAPQPPAAPKKPATDG